ncbi:sigma-54 dependent transcriptional regulator [Maridesulfovibrio sp.]|uniref:sigma-54 interaction domain-containing protein n=1 Tax=Maridesulfovibrio sp. TaxID=2795000 RepID=UPI0029C9CCBC|nr:sigma-54 dependent transcriptional regulator [Maridesulfovibrio sp.]
MIDDFAFDDIDDFYPAPSRTEELTPQDRLNENIARIELLKIKVMTLSCITHEDQVSFINDLDTLREAFVQSTLPGPASPAGAVSMGKISGAGTDALEIEGILGNSQPIQKIIRTLSRVAATDMTMLLEGETGCGKELFARIIHLNSNRRNFLAVNCGAFAPNIIESELFGHVKGAFTGAVSDRNGKFVEADGGTLFLDEIGELELSAQVKLLRVLETGEVQRVGSEKTTRTDIRVVAATNRNLVRMVHEGSFREDLYYRINTCPIIIPPLRDRRDEIPVLLKYFLEDFCKHGNRNMPEIDKDLYSYILNDYPFPGNIRELKNLAQFIYCIYDGTTPVTIEDIPAHYRSTIVKEMMNEENEQLDLLQARQDAEVASLIKFLEKNKGNIVKTCAELNISRSRAYQLFNKYEIVPSDFRR